MPANSSTRRLTLFEAASIVAGYGIGGGVMTVPYLAEKNGLVPALLIMAAALCISLLLHLMIAEMFSGDGEPKQVVEFFHKHLFRGKSGAVLTWVFFVLMGLVFLANLAAYIAGAGEILQSLTGLPLWAGEALFYLFAAGVVFFGLKVLGVCEKYAILGIVAILAVLAAASALTPSRMLPAAGGGANAALAFFGMMMFCFGAFFSVPQAVEGLSHNKKLVPRAVVLGMGMNFVFILVIALCALLVSKEVTEVAIIGWSAAIGGWATILGSLFVLLAMVTTYWSISFAFSTIVRERLRWGDRPAWLMATLPSFLIAIIGFSDFLGFMRLAGGGIAVLVAVLMVPAFRSARKARQLAGDTASWNIGLWGGTAFQIAVAAGYILMAVGSVIPIE